MNIRFFISPSFRGALRLRSHLMPLCRHTATNQKHKIREARSSFFFPCFLVSPNDAKLPEIQNSSVAVTLCAKAGDASTKIRYSRNFKPKRESQLRTTPVKHQ